MPRVGKNCADSTQRLQATAEALEPRRLMSAVEVTSLSQPGLIATQLIPLGDKIIISTETPPNLWVTSPTVGGVQNFESGLSIPREGDLFNEDAGGPTAVRSGGTVFFAGSNGALYKTDGTAAGTILLRSFDSLGTAVLLSDLTAVNGGVYFSATSSTIGEEPWFSDGTPQGTYPLAQLVSGTPPGNQALARNFTVVNGTLFFSTGLEKVYKSDGSATGTVPVTDALFSLDNQPGTRDTFLNFGGKLLFEAPPGITGIAPALWASDGTAAGTEQISPSGLSLLHGLISFGSDLYFEVQDSSGAFALWKTDGTAAGTSMFKALGRSGSFPPQFCVVGDTLYFAGPDGFSLWKSDGTPGGTQIVKSFPKGPDGVLNLVNAGGMLYFLIEGQVWTTDGTDAGTVEADNSPKQITAAGDLTVVDGQVFFLASTSQDGPQLWTIEPPIPETVPEAPGGLTVNAASGSEVDLNWSAGPNQAGFLIERSTDPTFRRIYSSVNLPDPTATRYVDTTVIPGTTYYYRVTAYNRNGKSAAAASTVATPLTPIAPSYLTANPSSERVDLSWAENSSDVTAFVVERSHTPSFATVDATFSVVANATSFSDTSVRPLNEYFYRVAAVNSVGRSISTVLRTVTPDLAPSGLTALGASSSEIDLHWTSNASMQTSFRIDRAVPGGPFVTINYVPSTQTSYADVNLPVYTKWTYRVVQVGGYYGASASDPATGVTLLPGDADADGKVDFADLTILARHYGMKNATFADGDFNGDGVVDFADLVILARNYGQTTQQGLAADVGLSPQSLSDLDVLPRRLRKRG